jgi:VWFA-related protein
MAQGKGEWALSSRGVAAGVLLLTAGSFLGLAAQQQGGATGSGGQAQAPTAPANNADSEITTRSTDTAIKVHVNLVLVRVVVKDNKGVVVGGLKKEDFHILDEGKEQAISTFSMETAETMSKTTAPAGEPKTEAKTEETPAEPGPAGAPAVNPAVLPQRFVALVFDNMHMKGADALAVHGATEKLFMKLVPTDRVAIYSTSGEVNQDFTGDVELLRKTLAAVKPRPGRQDDLTCPNISYYEADLIENKHDPEALAVAQAEAQTNCQAAAGAVRSAAQVVLQKGDQDTRTGFQLLDRVERHLGNMPGQRVMVYVSPGFQVGEEVLSENMEFIDRATKAGIVVNTIDARGLYTADQMGDIAAPPSQSLDRTTIDWQGIAGTYRMQAQLEDGQVMAGIAAGTGGTFFHNRNDLDVAMSLALAPPAISYVLGFSPPNLKADGKLHKLKVTISSPGKYQVQARTGYFSPKQIADPQEAAKQEVRDALFAQDEMVDLPVDLKTQYFKMDAASVQLTVITHLDIKGIHFRKAGGRSYNNVVLATAVFDDNGKFVDGQMREITLKLKDTTMERLGQTGFTIKTAFTVKPGTYLVRSVVRGSEGDQLTARNMTTVIPD